MNAADDLARHMDRIARELFGVPNERLSNQRKKLRYGTNGSLSIDLAKGTFYDFEARQGGGVLDLIAREKGLVGEAAFDFIRQIGCDIGGHDSTGRKLRATFDYVNAGGELIFQVCRFEPKDFRQRRPNGNGWIWNLNGVRRVPYRLPELLEAVALNHVVFIVEGERKVDALANWNVPATCCAGGSGKWKPEHSEYLRGANVVILPDNDDPGRDHANIVGAALQGIAVSVRLLELPGLEPKGDIVDWIKAGGTAEQFWKLVETQARPWAPYLEEREHGPWDVGLISRKAANITPEKVDWLWVGRIARGKHTCIAGEPGTGKSQLSIIVTAVMTTSGEWPCSEGWAPLGNVIILSAEDGPADTIVPRLMAAGADRDRVHIVSAVRTPNGKGQRTFNLQTDIELLERKIAEVGDVALVIVDPVSSYLGKTDSHKNSEVRGVLEPLSEMAERTRVAVLTVTHFNKTGVNGTTKALHRFIGSIAFTGAPRTAFAVIEDPEDANHRLFLHAKNNLAAPPQGLGFRLEQTIVADGILGSRVIWDSEPVSITANQALAAEAAGSDQRSAEAEAQEFLRNLLAEGPIAQKQVKDDAEGAGLAWATVRRAKDRLGVIARRETEGGFASGSGRWVWCLRCSSPPQGAHVSDVSTLSTDEHLKGGDDDIGGEDLSIPECLRR